MFTGTKNPCHYKMDQKEILWQPSGGDIKNSRLYEYRLWLKDHYSVETSDYESLWRWSVEFPDIFWESISSFFNVMHHTPFINILSGDAMPDHSWFEGSTLNYAEHIYRGMSAQDTAIIFSSEKGDPRKISAHEMWREVAKLQQYFINHGIKRGDRIAGYLPNIPQATYAFLASISLGAVWSCCSPDFGVSSVIDRFAQIEPKIFIAANGYYYAGKTHQRTAELDQIRLALPGLNDTLIVHYIDTDILPVPGISFYHELSAVEAIPKFEAVPFQHPLWILYSSGTTGAPKAITHSHGGCLLEHFKYLAFHNDVHSGEVFFWYSTTGWMMWNFLHASMLLGATIVLYDGSPGFPDLNNLWSLASTHKINHFGTSAPFIVACMNANLKPKESYDLKQLRSIGSTGSPLPHEAFDWIYDTIHNRIWLCSMSGGTDVCTAFVGGVIEKPVIRGEIQARGLGCALYAFDDVHQPTEESLGEMVITKPMPSMPVYFWNDPDKVRYKSSYFEDIPGVWRHGDWVKITSGGGIVIYGRSDATLNRHGVRIGTAEIYRALNDVNEIEDSLIVNLELNAGRHYMPLFVKMKHGTEITESIKKSIAVILKTKCSPRHIPDDIIQVDDIPYTISGKKMEAPVKKILMGMKSDHSLNKDAMRNPESLRFFEDFVVPQLATG